MFGGEYGAYSQLGNVQPGEQKSELPPELELEIRLIQPTWKRRGESIQSEDLIMVAEFSEIEGPRPLIMIPHKNCASKDLDVNAFALKLMAVDSQKCQSPSAVMSIQDTQALMEHVFEDVHAYVHYFTLYDVEARGYVRPFCMAYITPDIHKLRANFDVFVLLFNEVSVMMRSGNHLNFLQDLQWKLQDIKFTREKQMEWEHKREERAQQSRSTRRVHYLSNYFRKLQSRDLDLLEVEISRIKEDVEKHMSEGRDVTRMVEQSETTSKDDSGMKDLVNGSGKIQVPERAFTRSLSCHSQPQHSPSLVKLHTGKRFDKVLRTIHELCGTLRSKEALGKLRTLHKNCSQTAHVLNVQLDAEKLLFAMKPVTYGTNASGTNMSKVTNRGSRASTWTGSQRFYSMESFVSFDDEAPALLSSLTEDPILGSSYNSCEHGSFANSVAAALSLAAPSSRQTSSITAETTTLSVPKDDDTRVPRLSGASTWIGTQHSSQKPYFQLNLGSKTPNSSTGYGVLELANRWRFFPHLVYAVLSGKTVIVVGNPSQVDLVAGVVSTLALFLPATRASKAVQKWKQRPIDANDINVYKLIGYCRHSSQDQVSPELRKLVCIFDVEKEQLLSVEYKGIYLQQIYKTRKSYGIDADYLCYLEGILQELVNKAYIYHHIEEINDELHTPSSVWRLLDKLNLVPDDQNILKAIADELRSSVPAHPIRPLRVN